MALSSMEKMIIDGIGDADPADVNALANATAYNITAVAVALSALCDRGLVVFLPEFDAYVPTAEGVHARYDKE